MNEGKIAAPSAAKVLPRQSAVVPRARVSWLDVCVLAGLPVFDVCVDQLLQDVQVGNFSALQIVRGLILVLVAIRFAVTIDLYERVQRNQFKHCMLLALCASLFIAKEQAVAGDQLVQSIKQYLQIAYWVLIWSYAVVVARSSSPQGVALVLRGLVLASGIATLSIFYGYATGRTFEDYAARGVEASSGFFGGGKAVNGLVLTGGIVAPFVIANRGIAVFAPVVAIVAVFFTYTRTSLVAAALVVLWLIYWRFVFTTKLSRKHWLTVMLLVLCGGFLYICIQLDVLSNLERRWADIHDQRTAGSGRLKIWTSATQTFLDSDMGDQVFGLGIQPMRDAMHNRVGTYIHTHNDLFDALLVGGIVGVFMLMRTWYLIVRRVWPLPRASLAFALGGSILVSYFAHSLLTGQIFAPTAMGAYMIGIVFLTELSLRHVSDNR